MAGERIFAKGLNEKTMSSVPVTGAMITTTPNKTTQVLFSPAFSDPVPVLSSRLASVWSPRGVRHPSSCAYQHEAGPFTYSVHPSQINPSKPRIFKADVAGRFVVGKGRRGWDGLHVGTLGSKRGKARGRVSSALKVSLSTSISSSQPFVCTEGKRVINNALYPRFVPRETNNARYKSPLLSDHRVTESSNCRITKRQRQ